MALTIPARITITDATVKAVVTQYWLEHYAGRYCSLCCNRGVIDSTHACVPERSYGGRVNYCICPEGMSQRAAHETGEDL